MKEIKPLVFATDNKNKVSEINTLVPEGFPYIFITKNEAGIQEPIAETSSTIHENARIKADYIKSNYDLDCFAEDTGLIVDSLGGEPGVYSARYAGPENDSDKNIDLLLKNLIDKTDRRARFMTVIALIIGSKEYLFEGIVEGEILIERKGKKGFGYDPVFLPSGFDQSFAEMDTLTKNKISHRGIAVKKMLDFLLNYNLD
jgi:XTP/dITP diphosphohydrolase